MKLHYLYILYFMIAVAAGSALGLSAAGMLSHFGINGAEYAQPVQAIITVIFGYTAVWLLSHSIIEYGRGKPRMDEKPLAKMVSLIGYIIIALIILANFQINITGLLIGAGFLGVVIGFAAQPTLGNLFSGVSMMAAKPFANGDRITFSTWQYGMLPPSFAHGTILPGYSGVIEEMGLMYTKLRLDSGTSLFVPNGIMNQASIINYSLSETIEISLRVELPLHAEFGEFKRAMMLDIARHKKLKGGIRQGPRISITDIELSNYGVEIKAVSTIKDESYVRAELSSAAFRIAGRLSKAKK